MSEPEGQELQDKLVTIWYVMDQYQRDVEQWYDQKRKLKEKKEYLEMNGTTSKVFTSVVVLFALFYLLLGFFTRNFSSFFMIVLLSVFYLLMRKTHEKLAKASLIILALTVIQTAEIFVQGIMSGDLGAYLILALLIPLTIFAIRTGLRGNQSYIDKYNEHVRQYNEPYLQKMIQLQEDGAKQDKALKELTNGWFPSAYLSPNVVLTFIDYMKKKRATTMKELANLYEMDKLYAHQMQMTQEIIDSNRSIDNQLRFSNMIGMYQIIQMDNIKDFVRRYW